MKHVTEALAAAVGALLSFFTGLPPIIWVLVAVMTLDYITGLACGLAGKSQKTQNGGLSSNAAFRGLLKKALILIVVGLAALVDHAITVSAGVEMAAVTGATCLWFVASEGLSILENAATMEVPIPKVLMRALEIIREKGDNSEKEKTEKK